MDWEKSIWPTVVVQVFDQTEQGLSSWGENSNKKVVYQKSACLGCGAGEDDLEPGRESERKVAKGDFILFPFSLTEPLHRPSYLGASNFLNQM